MKISIKREQSDACISSAEREKFGTKFKNSFRFLSMAALVLMGAVMTGCSSEDNIDNLQQPENKSNVVTLTTTISLDGGAGTRALTANGVKTFAAGDKIAIIYKNISGNQVKAVSNELKDDGDITGSGKKATFTVTLVDPDKTKQVVYYYPAAMLLDNFAMNWGSLYCNQDGTLETLGSKFDFCISQGDWAGDNLPSLTLDNQLAILACTLKNEAGSSEITSSITGMTISDGTYSYSVNPSSLSTIYVAIRPTSSSGITVTATDGTKIYTKSLTGKPYAAGNGYSVSWRMTQKAENVVSLATIGSVLNSPSYSYTAQTGDVLTGVAADYNDPNDDTKNTRANVDVKIADGATVILRDMTLDGSLNPSSHRAGINCEGNATIILEGTNSVTGFHSGYPGISVPAGKTLTIQGDGSLTVRSNGAAAGIGGGGGACGNIVINSGTITAYAYTNYEISTWGAGIGGARGNCGDITINGGNVTAYGGRGGAGIGSGDGGACGNITINRGTVTATGGDDAAGIGGGVWGSCGNITIAKTITSVTATKGNNTTNTNISNKYTDAYSIGIGGDYLESHDGMNCACGTITFDTQSFTPEKHLGDADHDNSWTYSPEPVSGTSYGGLTLTISDKTWTLVPTTTP